MDSTQVDLLLMVAVAVVSGIVGMLTLKLSQSFERRNILRKKRFEKEYEVAERIIKDTSELLYIIDNLGNSIDMYFDYKARIADGQLTEEEMAEFIAFYKIYVQPNVKLEDAKRELFRKAEKSLDESYTRIKQILADSV